MIVLTIVVFVIILGILIFAHELGHFLAAKSLGVRVEEFGFGFPPRLVRLFKKGDTEYTINWIPVGGFVKMTGQSDFEVEDQDKIKDDPKSFLNKKPWQRLIILSAGVGMNFALAAILLAVGFMIGLPAAVGVVPCMLRRRARLIIGVTWSSGRWRASNKWPPSWRYLQLTRCQRLLNRQKRVFGVLFLAAGINPYAKHQTPNTKH